MQTGSHSVGGRVFGGCGVVVQVWVSGCGGVGLVVGLTWMTGLVGPVMKVEPSHGTHLAIGQQSSPLTTSLS